VVFHELSLETIAKIVGRNEDEAASQSQGRRKMMWSIWGIGKFG